MIIKGTMEIFASKIDVWLYILQSLLQDISSHQRMVDSVVEKAQGVLQTTNNPDVAFLIKDISSRYEHIARTAKVKQNGVHLVVHDFQKFKYFPA